MNIHPVNTQTAPGEAPAILPPARDSIFSKRAERFTRLAEGHALGEWLRFLARLSSAQDAALCALPPPALPDADTLAQARAHGMPPLNVSATARPESWRAVLRQLLAAVETDAPESARPRLQSLAAASDEELEALADALLREDAEAADAGRLTFVAAALQVVWTALAASLDGSTLQKLDPPGVCPCCGSLPVGSIVRLGDAVNNLRYLHCSLCNTEWNIPRAVCTSCGTDQGVAYQELAGEAVRAPAAVRAETCDHCHSYLKMCLQDKDPLVDPVADDLATLPLDLLVDEAGYERSGPNLFLLGGAA